MEQILNDIIYLYFKGYKLEDILKAIGNEVLICVIK